MATLKTNALERGEMNAYLAMACSALEHAERVAVQAARGQDFPYHGHPLGDALRDCWVRVRGLRDDILNPDTDWTFKRPEEHIKLTAHRIEEMQERSSGVVAITSDEVEELLQVFMPPGTSSRP